MSTATELRRAGISARRAGKGDLELYDASDRPRARHINMLDRYYTEGKIKHHQQQAGRQFYDDWSRSGWDPWATSPDNIRSVPGSRTPGQGPRSAEYLQAAGCLPPLERTIVVHVCIENSRVTTAADNDTARKTLWNLLHRGLDILARHYGMIRP